MKKLEKMTSYEKDLLEVVEATCNEMYNDGKSWFDLSVYVTKILAFYKKHHNLSTEFVENLEIMKKTFLIMFSKTK